MFPEQHEEPREEPRITADGRTMNSSIWNLVYDQARDRVLVQVWDRVGRQVRGQVGRRVLSQIRVQVRNPVWRQITFVSHGLNVLPAVYRT